jgi:hypothetical protein
MADSTTTNFGLVKPGIGESRDTWGGKLNANLDAIDTQMKANKTVADGALPKAGGKVTGEVMRDTAGAVPYWDDPAMVRGRMFITPDTAANPTGNLPGTIWFGYTP